MAPSSIRLLAPLGAFLFACSAEAALMGPLEVRSRLGQGFVAEVAVSGDKSELDSLRVSHPAPEVYLTRGLDYDAAVRGLSIALERKNDGLLIVHLRSDRGVNLPVGNLLLQARWEGGGLLRDYAFLLDPPEEVNPVAARGERPLATAPSGVAVELPAPMASTAPNVASESTGLVGAAPGEYRTRAGDSLERVARRADAGGASRMQVMAAIYQANPQAFVDGDASRMRRDTLVKLPDEAAAKRLDAAAARTLVMQAAGGFERHRKAVAEAAAAAPATEGEATRHAAGRITPEVQEPAPTRTASGRLHIGQGQGAGATTRQRIAAMEEEIASKAKSLDEQNARIRELEETMAQLNQLLAMQQTPAAEPSAPPAETAAASAPEAMVVPPQPQDVLADAAPVQTRATPMRNAEPPAAWYEDTAVQLLLVILAALGAAWLAYRRYRERAWQVADRELQRQRGMPVDESELSLA